MPELPRQVLDALLAFHREHQRMPARVYVSADIRNELLVQEPMMPVCATGDRSTGLIGFHVVGTDWFVDPALEGDDFRVDDPCLKDG